MIQQLLAFAGGSDGEKQVVDLGAVVYEIEEILEHTLPKTITVTVDCPAEIWDVLGDPTELSQVLMNLSINARDAMLDGGTLVFEVVNLYVDNEKLARTQLPRFGRYVQLTIADTGCGMSADVVEHAFDPFFTTKEQGKGTGLGLATSQGIVRAHGGVISTYSEEGRGTKFTIYLPAGQHATTQTAQTDSDAPPSGAGETVLLVDDEALILEMTRATLELHGYHVLTANGGGEALAILQHEGDKIAAAVVDMMMPGMDGQTTIDGLRALRSDLPVIASSGLRRPDTDEHRIRDAQAFLPKPYSDEQLLRTIDGVIVNSVVVTTVIEKSAHEKSVPEKRVIEKQA